MNKLITVITGSAILLMVACSTDKHVENSESTLTDIMKVDREFSKLSEETNISEAFYEFAAESAVILRENSMPIIGRSNISNLFENTDRNIVLTWEPIDGDIAVSGDLGYTYGTYQLKIDTLVSEGTYVSVWKKTTQW